MFYNKVEISGVSTANLKILKEAEKIELLKKMKTGSTSEFLAARQELIQGNLKLVLSVIKKFTARDNADDLFQVGVIGLIKAIDNFDVTIGVRFSTYAVPMILGEIKRYLRDNSQVKISRGIRDIAYKALKAREEMIEANPSANSEPSYDAIAKSIGVTREEVALALEAITEPISLYEPVFNDGGDTVYVMDQIGDKHDDDEWVDKIALEKATQTLSEREKNILNLRYYIGKTQVEVADSIGISQAQVSRLEKGALTKIKRRM